MDLAKPLVQAEPTHRAHVQTTILTQETFEEVDAAAAPEQPTEEHIVVSPVCSDLIFYRYCSMLLTKGGFFSIRGHYLDVKF